MTRTRPRTTGSLALKLDFDSAGLFSLRRPMPAAAGLRLAARSDKYKVLEHRRRQAQIAARRLLDSMEGN